MQSLSVSLPVLAQEEVETAFVNLLLISNWTSSTPATSLAMRETLRFNLHDMLGLDFANSYGRVDRSCD